MNKNGLIVLLLCLAPGLMIGEVMAACSNVVNEKNIPATTPTNQFSFDNSSDVVTDNKTGLMWARCPAGYGWMEDGNRTCTVLAGGVVGLMSWSSALAFASDNADSYLGYSDWRLPNVKELASIIERRCAGYAVNHDVFGPVVTFSSKYWSNTHVRESGSARSVNYSSGNISVDTPTSSLLVRLVRDVTP